MSDDSAPADPLGPRRRRVRWLDALVSALVGLAVALVLGVAAPSLLVAAGVVEPRPPSAAPVITSRRSDVPPLFRDTDLDDDDYPRETRGPRGSRAHEERDGGGRSLGLARRELVLLDGPEEDATPIGRVPGGEVVMLIRDLDDWLLVVYSGSDGMAMGWVQKNNIAVR